MNIRSLSKIWVVFILVVFVAGGILVWQYFGELKERVGVLEEVKVPEKAEVLEEEPGWQSIPGSGERWIRDKTGTVITTRMNGLNFYNELSDSAQIVSTIPYGSKIQIDKIGGIEEKPGTWYHGIWQNKEGWFDLFYALEDLNLFQEDFYHYKYFENYPLKELELYGYNLEIYGEGNLPLPINIQMPNNPKVGLDKIRAKVIYFRPNDFDTAIYHADDSMKEDWFGNLDKAFKRIKSFHEKEFARYSAEGIKVKKPIFKYDIYPSIVKGEHSEAFYRGPKYNPSQVLLSVIDEIREEVFSLEGEYYNKNFVSVNSDEYPIVIAVTETNTVGGQAIERRAVVSANLLRSGNYRSGISCFEAFLPILYHEILHTIGLVDERISSEFEMEIAFLNESIMAKTDTVPLESNYISKRVKAMMFRY